MYKSNFRTFICVLKYFLGEIMETLYIEGGRELNGEIEVSTAKNSMLPILAASLLCSGSIVLHKVTKFSDVINMTKILKSLGCELNFEGEDLIIDASTASNYIISDEFSKKIRSSIFLLGSLLTRFKKAKVAYPGGCDIGNRPIDLHIKGLKNLNVKIEERHGYILCDGKDMRAGEVHLDFPSVGATENLIMASVGLKGKTIIYNAAREPEIEDLQNFINSIGGKVYGAGTSTIMIEGVDRLHGSEYTPMQDRIIAGTYMIACAMCGGHINLKNYDKKYNHALIQKLKQSGTIVKENYANIEIISKSRPESISLIDTQPYPGFPTDLQNQILVMQTISNGTSVIVENLFENRFKICGELNKMGADITIKDRMAIIKGVNTLYGAKVTASDLRGGAGLVLAGLVAKGYTTIEDIYHIDRGYMSIEEDFCKLNAEIRRIKN